MNRSHVPVLLACALFLMIPRDARANPAEKTPDRIRIGVVLGLTGAEARWASYQRMGMELAAADLSSGGRTVELQFEDSASLPKQAVAAFTKLAAVDRVPGVLGDIFSMMTLPIIPLAQQRKVTLISPATPASLCAADNPYFYSTATQVPLSAEGYGYFLDRHPQVKRVALVYFLDPGWGHLYRDAWKKLLAERGLVVTGEFESADFLPDFKSALPKLMSERPDAFFVAHESKSFLAASRQLGFRGEYVFANNILEIPASGEDTAFLEGIHFVDTLPSAEFSAKFRERFGREPLLEPYNGYESVRAFVKAMESNPAHPEQALRGMRYDGASGELDFRESCAGNRSRWHLKRFSKGAVTLVQ